MKTTGEFIFNSYEEALNFVNEPTNYEKEHGIVIEKNIVISDKPDIKVIGRLTTDNRLGLFIFFRNSTVYDIWKFWCPSNPQFQFLTQELPNIIRTIEAKNEK